MLQPKFCQNSVLSFSYSAELGIFCASHCRSKSPYLVWGNSSGILSSSFSKSHIWYFDSENLIYQAKLVIWIDRFWDYNFRLLPFFWIDNIPSKNTLIIIFQNNDYLIFSIVLKVRIKCKKDHIYDLSYLPILPIIGCSVWKIYHYWYCMWYQCKMKKKEKLSKIY